MTTCTGQYDVGLDWNGWRRARSPVKSRTARSRPGPWSTPRSANGESYLAAGRSPVRQRADFDARTDPPGLASAIMAA
jgi:hypothetical protein